MDVPHLLRDKKQFACSLVTSVRLLTAFEVPAASSASAFAGHSLFCLTAAPLQYAAVHYLRVLVEASDAAVAQVCLHSEVTKWDGVLCQCDERA